ncbi:helicase C-terminal domain-containing protein [Phlyctochytrium arcticum]|nr:helicase C-terminal domain-containing protein [Phlyctochytrium arcticum]
MPSYNIRGVTVQFPYNAYDCQIDLMDKVIASLQAGSNGLVESPTGTGKTLCLLCATLAWREAYSARKQLHKAYQSGIGMEDGGFKTDLLKQLDSAVSTQISKEQFDEDLPTIYYASRTHSQLSQAVSELRNTAYRPKICVLGSREQMCINPEVQAMPPTARGSVCKRKVQKRACEYHSNVDSVKPKLEEKEITMDIEELVKFGKQHSACPYFLSRATQTTADIVFLPYNYLIDSHTRKSQSIDVRNSILIFDEGHNLEGSCGDVTSFDITPFELSMCISEAEQAATLSEPSQSGNSEISTDEFHQLKDLLVRFREKVDKIELKRQNEVTLPGQWLYDTFTSLEINFDNVERIFKVIEGAISSLSHESHRRNARMALNLFATALKIVFKDSYRDRRDSLGETWQAYKVFIQQEKIVMREKNSWNGGDPQMLGRKISFWCFSAGVAMRELVEKGARSVVLASGTLSPLESFACEMGIPFPQRLENPHVIESHQAFVGVIPNGPGGVKLSSSYENRDSPDYLNDMGNAVVNFCRIVPDGFLVFFPSYGVMTKCVDAWKRMGKNGSKSTFDRIRQYKEPILEPRNKQEFAEAMEEFYRKLKDPSIGGAVFFAVCRGKASEGLDFSDTKGRAVMICGIPYPAAMDPKVKLKKLYLDEKHAEASRKGDKNVQTLSGRDWYTQQAARAVNQALGRVIRHRKDFGAILLCDARFGQPNNVKQLPVWVRKYVRVYNSFGEAQGSLVRFFKQMEEHITADRASNPQPSTSQAESAKVTTGHSTLLQHKSFQSIKVDKFSYLTDSSDGQVTLHARRIKREAKQDWMDIKTPPSASKPKSATLHSTTMDASQNSKQNKIPPQAGEFFRRLVDSENHSDATLNQPETKKRPRIPISNSQPTQGPESDTISLEQRKKRSAKAKQSAQPYIEEVRATLSSENFRSFQALLRQYKAQEVDVFGLISEVLKLFGSVGIARGSHLLHGFRPFMPARHSAYFEAKIAAFGQEID